MLIVRARIRHAIRKMVQWAIVQVALAWLGLVHRTTRFIIEPADYADTIGHDGPPIIAMWHGQHFMLHYARPRHMAIAALISRSADGDLNAAVLERLGVIPIRGAGGSGLKIRKRGGIPALREMLRCLSAGTAVALTADVPKIAREAGAGIAVLARLSGRPVYPVAVVCQYRLDLASWDRASIGVPFGRGAIVTGTPVTVPADADESMIETARRAIEAGLDDVHKRAYALVGSADPGGTIRMQRHTKRNHAG
jgi:lysophospholipid acyltransferase (LPLAT)-like uncharacterized protein